MVCSGRMPGISRLGERCCGCGACAAACPHGCIHMVADACGFEHPSVNPLQCACCGGCERVCPVIHSPDIPKDACHSAWWMHARDASVVSTSSSGGVFGLLASSVLNQGGLVCGAAMEGSCARVSHVLVGDTQSLGAVMGSKYVQNTISAQVYERVAKALCGGRKVLFSGCGCQVAAMRAYLAVKHVPCGGFLGVEVICHGVPAPTLWGAWIAHVAAQMREPIARVNFRDRVLCGGTDLESIARGNPSMMAPTSPHRQRPAFLEAVARGAPIGEMVHAWPFRHGIAGWATALLRFLARKWGCRLMRSGNWSIGLARLP